MTISPMICKCITLTTKYYKFLPILSVSQYKTETRGITPTVRFNLLVTITRGSSGIFHLLHVTMTIGWEGLAVKH